MLTDGQYRLLRRYRDGCPRWVAFTAAERVECDQLLEHGWLAAEDDRSADLELFVITDDGLDALAHYQSRANRQVTA